MSREKTRSTISGSVGMDADTDKHKRHSTNVELQNEKKEMILHYVSPSNKIDISDGGYSHL